MRAERESKSGSFATWKAWESNNWIGHLDIISKTKIMTTQQCKPGPCKQNVPFAFFSSVPSFYFEQINNRLTQPFSVSSSFVHSESAWHGMEDKSQPSSEFKWQVDRWWIQSNGPRKTTTAEQTKMKEKKTCTHKTKTLRDLKQWKNEAGNDKQRRETEREKKRFLCKASEAKRKKCGPSTRSSWIVELKSYSKWANANSKRQRQQWQQHQHQQKETE